MKQSFKVVKTPSEALALTNCAIINPRDARNESLIRINNIYYLTIKTDSTIPTGNIGLSSCHRTWIKVSLGETLEGEFVPENAFPELSSILMEVRFLRKSIQVDTPFETEHMATVFKEIFVGQPFVQEQSLIMDLTGHNLSLFVKSVEPTRGLLSTSTSVKFFAAADSNVKLVGSTRTQANPNAHLIESFRFKDMGIGGLGKEFADLFRRVFSTRLMQPQTKNEFGLMHVKGVLLYGPPGTGKTLIARQIGQVLRAREPKIVNGPEILNRFVGESERNIRALFEDAEQEYKAKGDASQLHIIIFDELDAICRQRGSARADTGVGDSIVNQLLAKMDGVDQLDNIVIIGMTNRLELIDEALLRPGRFEVHLPIGLPDQEGRLEILKIHTAAMQKSNRLDSSVDFVELATLSRNFTGAELCGLIRSATSFALTRTVKVGAEGSTRIDDSAIDTLKLTRQDFLQAFTEVKAANGISEEDFALCAPFGYIAFSPITDDILSEAAMAVRQVQSGKTSLYSLLLYGPPGTGKTALAAKIACESGFQYAKMINSYMLLGMSEAARVAYIYKVFADATQSQNAVILVDGIESLIEFVPMGPRFAMNILVTLNDLMGTRPPRGRLLVLATTSKAESMEELGALDVFDRRLYIPAIDDHEQIRKVLEHVSDPTFTPSGPFIRREDIPEILRSLPKTISIGIKPLLQKLGNASMASDDTVQEFLRQL